MSRGLAAGPAEQALGGFRRFPTWMWRNAEVPDFVLEQLVELRRHAGDYLRADGLPAEDRYFLAEQNAAVVADADHPTAL